LRVDKLKFNFPKNITSLPEADIRFKGVKGWIAQGDRHQVVFFRVGQSAEVPEHSHKDQWGIVVEGEMELTIEGKANIYRKGDEYFIPSQAKHSAKFLTECRIIDFFSENARFKPKG
jgi:quercetin dioxygenase-like cupin family protein